jgi:signal transduction histidine kinase/ABC-type amino acid transport substrate-binding protein
MTPGRFSKPQCFKHFLQLAAVCVFMLLIMSSGLAGAKSGEDIDLTSEERQYLNSHGPILFVSQTTYPPFEFLQKDNSMDGMSIELARWMATELGIKVKFLNMAFQQAQEAVLSGKADVITSLFYSEKRAEKFAFTEPLFDVPASIFVRADRPDISRLEDLKGKRIAIQQGDYAKDFLESKGIYYQLVQTEDFAQSTDAVLSGQADALIGDEQIVLFYLYSNQLNDKAKKVGGPLYIGKNCMATRKGNDIVHSIIAKALRRARESNLIEKTERKWLGSTIAPRQGELAVWAPQLAIGFVVLLLVTLLVIAVNRKLKKLVRAKEIEQVDTTKLLENRESMYADIFNHIGIGVSVISPEMKILSLNPVMQNWFPELNSNEEHICYRGFNNPPRETVCSYCPTIKTLKDGLVHEGITETPTPSGVCNYKIISTPMLDAQGQIRAAVEVVEDITERVSYEAKLKQAKAAAESANRAKSGFLANMSHELRTPMNGVLGMAQLLAYTDLDADQKEYVETIRLSGNNLLSIINNVLDLSKIESEMITIERADFCLRHTINDVVRSQQLRGLTKGLTVTTAIQDDIPEVLVGDQFRLKQIFLNLLDNAIKFTEIGGITISANIRERHASQIYLELSIQDSGIGMDQEVIERIFKPFEQADSSTTRRFGGTGLGLAICKRLIELMGGSIKAESEKGCGSRFSINITLGVAVSDPLSDESRGVLSGGFSLDGPARRVLIAEDNPINMQFAKAVVTKIGHEVTAANNGMEALSHYKQQNFDLILMDINMPVMSGVEALKAIRAFENGTERHVPIIAVTAYALQDERDSFMAAGFDGYVAKPIEFEELVTEMKRVLLSL